MKTVFAILGVSLLAMLSGCATPPRTSVATAAVGPNPIAPRNASSRGGLEVFSRLATRTDDQNQESTDEVWVQPTDYYLCDTGGRVMKHVSNAVGHYSSEPRTVSLPAGRYLIAAQASPNFWVKVPVTVKSGEITRVHLDGHWAPPAYADKSQVVALPDGRPIGWKL